MCYLADMAQVVTTDAQSKVTVDVLNAIRLNILNKVSDNDNDNYLSHH